MYCVHPHSISNAQLLPFLAMLETFIIQFEKNHSTGLGAPTYIVRAAQVTGEDVTLGHVAHHLAFQTSSWQSQRW